MPPISVLSVAYPFAPVGPDAVGGAEQVLTALDHALVAAGHRSLVIACAGSTTAGTLLELPLPPTPIDQAARDTAHRRLRSLIASTEVDLVHLHGIDFPAYLPPEGQPTLVTLHLPPAWYPGGALQVRRPRTWINCVSVSQQKSCPPFMPPTHVIPNGVPVHQLASARHAPRRYALTLGRICPEKGQHLALQACLQVGIPALLAGEIFPYPEHITYFDTQLRPLLLLPNRMLGPIGFARKRRLLAAAHCLLIPSLAAETSSLVAMEALACGTPVIAFPNGALPEIIEHGRTGFLVRNVSEMAAAIPRADEIDRSVCRQAAQDRFPLHRMTGAYLNLYQHLLACPDQSGPQQSAPQQSCPQQSLP